MIVKFVYSVDCLGEKDSASIGIAGVFGTKVLHSTRGIPHLITHLQPDVCTLAVWYCTE